MGAVKRLRILFNWAYISSLRFVSDTGYSYSFHGWYDDHLFLPNRDTKFTKTREEYSASDSGHLRFYLHRHDDHPLGIL